MAMTFLEEKSGYCSKEGESVVIFKLGKLAGSFTIKICSHLPISAEKSSKEDSDNSYSAMESKVSY
jgi:hypothetical protein